MLLNSYEGFDYMDYSRYSMCTKDWGIVFIKSMAATVIIAYLFYDSPIVVIAFPAVFAYCAKLCRQEGVRRQKEKLNEEFMNVLKIGCMSCMRFSCLIINHLLCVSVVSTDE